MTIELIRVRDCDGACCAEAPRWPTSDGCHCRFYDNGCQIMRGEAEPPETCPALPEMTGLDAFNWSCRDWPQNMPGRGTGGCCLQWRERVD